MFRPIKYCLGHIIDAITLQTFQLEWLTLLEREKGTKREKILHEILQELKTNGAFVFDEVDIAHTLSKELNFPKGSKHMLEPVYAELIEDVFAYHLKEEIEQELGLLRGEQGTYPKEQYKQKIIPQVAREFFEKYRAKIALPPHFEKPFLDWIIEGKEDKGLLEYLEKRVDTSSVQLAYLAKGLFQDLLPFIMTRFPNKHYGLLPESDRKVCPYLGVDSPASTEFAGPYETACYQYLTALSIPFTKEYIETFAKKSMEAARIQMEIEGIPLENTEEYRVFQDFFGTSLDKAAAKKQEALLEAIEYLKANPLKRLALEKRKVESSVGAYTEFYRSNALNLCGLGKGKIGLTGTPWNPHVEPQEMRKNTVLEKGSEGKVMKALLQRSDEGISKAFYVKSRQIKEIMMQIYKENPRKEKIRSLLDAGGYFRDLSNEAVAKEICANLPKDSPIDTVLFYGREKGETLGVPGTLMALYRGQEEGEYTVERIGETGREALVLKGIDPERTMTYFDEKHCEATDILQIEEGVGLVMVSSALTQRDLLQTVFRMRGYLEKQDCDFVVTEEERKNYGSFVTPRAILEKAIIEQAINCSEESVEGFSAQIDEIVRNEAYEKLLEGDLDPLERAFQETFVTRQDLRPSAIFGGREKLQTPGSFFKEQIQKKLVSIETREKIASLEKEIEENIGIFPSTVKKNAQFGRAATIETETELANTLEVEGKKQFYDKRVLHPREETKQIEPLPIEDFLTSVRYDEPYNKLFQSGLLVSKNFAYTDQNLHPVFAPVQKRGDLILVKGESCTLLSAKEAAAQKQKIASGEITDEWLYLPSGELAIKGVKEPPLKTPALELAFLEINIFNGNVAYLLKNKKKLLQKVEKDPTQKKLLLSFLSAKIDEDSPQRQLFPYLEKICK